MRESHYTAPRYNDQQFSLIDTVGSVSKETLGNVMHLACVKHKSPMFLSFAVGFLNGSCVDLA